MKEKNKNKTYYEKNKEIILAKAKNKRIKDIKIESYEDRKERLLKKREYMSSYNRKPYQKEYFEKYYKENRDEINKKRREKRAMNKNSNTIKKENILELVKARKSEHERLGQAVFNFCIYLFPEKAHELRATNKDPFHNDSVIDEFLEHVIK